MIIEIIDKNGNAITEIKDRPIMGISNCGKYVICDEYGINEDDNGHYFYGYYETHDIEKNNLGLRIITNE